MYDRLKGFRDFYPEEMAARREIVDTVEDACRRYGFRETASPFLEPAEMWTDKSGEDIVDELYAFEDKGERHVTLAPELTPTAARMIAAKQQELSKPIKWFSTRPFWRYEQVQQGRFREFYQTNADIFGTDDPRADAEVIALAAEYLSDLGLDADDVEIRVSHRDILGAVLRSFDSEVDVRAAIRAVDKSEKIDRTEYHDLLHDAGLSYDEAAEFDDLLAATDRDSLSELADTAGTDTARDAVSNLTAVLDAVDDLGAGEFCTLSLETARGLDYYTGVVFECFDAAGEVSRAVLGGGRYDDLIEEFGGQPTPAVGFGQGYATLPLLLERAGVAPEESLSTDYYVLQVGDTEPAAASVTRELRAQGHVVETDLSGRSFGAQLGYADSINAETVVIVGENDLAEGNYTLRDMETGEQETVPVSEFPA
ncbi:histidine--tRNA ligase [Halobacteriales archaeon QH_7_65_31]|nr:MAG: histidine--tRNA ligase [Halobacteriales archaeon QH_7_65_31]